MPPMSLSEPAGSRGDGGACAPPWWSTLGLWAAALLLYLATAQERLHGTDWRYLVLWTEAPGYVHPQHPGYLVLAKVAASCGAWFGVGTVAALGVLSALGGAVAVALVQRLAACVGGSLAAANVAALLCALLPGWWHHATVVEMHAPFLAVAVAASLLASRWWRGGVRQAAAAGAWTGLAAWLHATGHFLLPAFALAVWWLGGRSRRRVGEGLVAGVAHAAVWAVLFFGARAFGELPPEVLAAPKDSLLDASGGPLGYLLRSFAQVHVAAAAWPTLQREWLEPFAPVAVLCWLAWRATPQRGAVVVLLLVACAYLAMAMVMLDAITDERGAYLLPLAVPAACLTLVAVGRRWWPLLLVAALMASWQWRGEPGRAPADRAFGRQVAAAAAGLDAVWFVADYAQMDGAHLAAPRLPLLVAQKEYADLLAQGWRDPAEEQIAGWLALKQAEAAREGRRLVVLAATHAYLAARLPQFAAGWQRFATLVQPRRLPASTGLDGWLVGG